MTDSEVLLGEERFGFGCLHAVECACDATMDGGGGVIVA